MGTTWGADREHHALNPNPSPKQLLSDGPCDPWPGSPHGPHPSRSTALGGIGRDWLLAKGGGGGGASRVFLGGGGSKGGGWVGLWGGPPPPSGDPELLEAPKKFFGLN